MKRKAPPDRPKKQTRLSFTPLPSSSPAKRQLSSPVAHRAAAVRYTNPSKKRKLEAPPEPEPTPDDGSDSSSSTAAEEENGSSDSEAPQALPTPGRSSQAIFSGGRRSARKSELLSQSRIDFSYHAVAEKLDDDPPSSPPVRAKASKQLGMFGVKNVPITLSDSSDSDDSATPPSTTTKHTRGSIALQAKGSKSKSKKKKSKKKATAELATDVTAPTRKSTRTSKRKKEPKKEVVISSESSEESDIAPRSRRKPRRGNHQDSESEIGDAETTGDEVLVSTPPKKTRRNNKMSQKEDEQTEDDEDDDDDEEDEIPVAPRARQTPLKNNVHTPESSLNEDSADEEEEDGPVSPRKRRFQLTQNPKFSRQEQDDLDEDLEFLQSSPKHREGMKATPKPNKRQQALELLKQRRAGGKTDMSSPQRPSAASYEVVSDDTDSEAEDNELEAIDEDEVDDSQLGADMAITRDMFNEDDDDKNFIAEEEEGGDSLGVPVDIPIQFTALYSAKTKELFKHVVEWMVQKKINPGFPMEDEIYRLAFNKLEDEVKGLAGSKFTSSAWRPNFIKALNARPNMTLLELSPDVRSVMMDHCEACNRTGHPATWSIQFTGKPYYSSTLEEVSDNEDEDDGDDGTYDSEGRSIPDEETTFTVGRFCMQNAQTAHTLQHWRYHLNDWVVDYLVREGHCTPAKLVERDNWKTKKRGKYADQVVADMAERGEIRKLYHDFRVQIDHARDMKQQKFRRFG